MNVVFAGYRKWALDAFVQVISRTKNQIGTPRIVSTPEELNRIEGSVILGAGWSWILPESVIEKNEVIALIHPSDLPEYAGGSPIQHQIIDGIVDTKASLFKVTKDLDAGPIFLKEEMSLAGNMNQIFKSLTDASVLLMTKFISSYPDLDEAPQVLSERVVKKRLQPKDSKIERKEFERHDTKKLYNLIRCREEPYPNVYIEDEKGRLYFSKVRFEPHE